MPRPRLWQARLPRRPQSATKAAAHVRKCMRQTPTERQKAAVAPARRTIRYWMLVCGECVGEAETLCWLPLREGSHCAPHTTSARSRPRSPPRRGVTTDSRTTARVGRAGMLRCREHHTMSSTSSLLEWAVAGRWYSAAGQSLCTCSIATAMCSGAAAFQATYQTASTITYHK
eukprot:356995-Chlamydomonas_euryale.AAC.14